MTYTARMSQAPQHLRALERANAVRLARADLKRRVASGDTTASAVILDAPWEADSMMIGDLLTSQRRWGTTRSRRLLQTAAVPESKTIGAMTERQRRLLAALLTPAGTSEPEPAAALAAAAA